MRKEFTKQQMFIAKIIEDMGFRIDCEHSIPPYHLDIYIPEIHAAVEIDGIGHTKKGNAKRDVFLFDKYGLETMRIDNGECMSINEERIILRLYEFFINHMKTARDRKLKMTTG